MRLARQQERQGERDPFHCLRSFLRWQVSATNANRTSDLLKSSRKISRNSLKNREAFRAELDAELDTRIFACEPNSR